MYLCVTLFVRLFHLFVVLRFRYDCLLVVDTVASLGGTPFFMDKWLVDVVYTGSQKVLGAPPGLAPISFNSRAITKVRNRNKKVPVYYWDIMLLSEYWNCFGKPRMCVDFCFAVTIPMQLTYLLIKLIYFCFCFHSYHHTISASLLYGLREALAVVCNEGLEKTIARHQKASFELHSGLNELGLQLYVKNAAHRLPTITSIKVPKEIDWKKIVEIGANE